MPNIQPQTSKIQTVFNIWQQVMGQLNWLLFLVLVLVLPYNRFIIQPLWVIWFAAWGLEFRWLQRSTYRKWMTKEDAIPALKQLIPVFGLAIFVLWEMLSSLWAAEPSFSWISVGRHASFLILPFVLVVGFNEHYDWQRVMRVFICGAVASVLIYAFTRFWVDNYAYAFQWSGDIRPFRPLEMQNMTVLMKHRLFYCMVLTMALVFTGYQWRYFVKKLGIVNGVLLLVLGVGVLLWGIWATSSRQSLLTLAVLAFMAVVMVVFRWTERSGLKRGYRTGIRVTVSVVALLLMVAALALCVKHHPRFLQLQETSLSDYEQHINDPTFEPRIAVWHVVWESRAEYPVYGLGAGQSTPFLTQHYKDRGWVEYAYHELRAHNQYFQIWMELGIVAVVLFVLLWLYMPWCYGKKRYLAAYFVAMMMLSMMTDTLFGVIEGIIVCCVLMMILDQYAPAKNTEGQSAEVA